MKPIETLPSRRLLPLALLTIILDCAGSPSEPEAFGPSPIVSFDDVFGESPLAGFLHIVPLPGSSGWRWRVEFDGTQREPIEGVADREIAIPYRYDIGGVFPVRVELRGSDGAEVLEELLVVYEPSDLEVIQRPAREIWANSPEGLTIHPSGVELYGSTYSGELVRLDSGTLAPLDRLLLPVSRVLGLSVTPSGRSLFAAHEKLGLTVVDLETLEVRHRSGWGRGYVNALDEDLALVTEHGTGNGEGLRIVKPSTSELMTSSGSFIPGHFDLDPSGDRLAVVNHTDRRIDILDAVSLTMVLSVLVQDPLQPRSVAFDPDGTKLYVTAVAAGSQSVFLVYDLATRLPTKLVPLGPIGSGLSYNPTARFSNGRYVAFDVGGSVVIVDTNLDLPRYRLDPQAEDVALWASVAAQPSSEFLYVLTGPQGSFSRVRVR